MIRRFQNLYQRRQFRQQQERHRLAEGRLTAAEAGQLLGGGGVIPLCEVQSIAGESVTIGMGAQPTGSHLLVVAPPSSQSDDYLIRTLLHWPDAALVVDTGGRLHTFTGAFRQKRVGPVYTLPGHQLDLGAYYRFWNETQAQKLHHYLMSPCPPEDREQMDRSIALYVAVGHYAYARKRNLMHVLLDVAACDLFRALQGLETIPYARLYVRQFSKGQSPPEAIHDSDVVAAFNLFARQMLTYQPYYSLFDSEPAEACFPLKWAQQKATLYLTFDSMLLQEIGGLVTAVIAGLIRHHLSYGGYRKVLLVLDEMIAGQIPNFHTMLQLVATYGVTVVLSVTSWQGLSGVLGRKQQNLFMHYFHHQLWYPPRDEATAQRMSKLLGSQLQQGTQEKVPALTAAEIAAWPADRVLVKLLRERPYCVVGQPLGLSHALGFPYAPPLPSPAAPAPRHYLDWLPALPALPTPSAATQQSTTLPRPVKIIESPKPEKRPQTKKKRGWK
jgi:hypothetical protein